ncbi:hypothetical protein PCANC_04867 [Puccinia coronata f. sp. avenae]|uniref:Uncharacterized protein n=1 Tax=Puccinia coronata f. sp. avenae TaxID=200324 RepID=A0A2N5W2I8_9BASI|nr:hypothetical protein PCASD_14920 [Puccinia coronata f. sp. avenae]PLW56463.1 hypothetical protein PCANC_04867 [Puccinia coronata f. sp. avenae]
MIKAPTGGTNLHYCCRALRTSEDQLLSLPHFRHCAELHNIFIGHSILLHKHQPPQAHPGHQLATTPRASTYQKRALNPHPNLPPHLY